MDIVLFLFFFYLHEREYTKLTVSVTENFWPPMAEFINPQ